jgi:hypothetical protein
VEFLNTVVAPALATVSSPGQQQGSLGEEVNAQGMSLLVEFQECEVTVSTTTTTTTTVPHAPQQERGHIQITQVTECPHKEQEES